MNIESFLLMRHELLLTAVAMIILMLEIFVSGDNKGWLRGVATVLFFAVTIIGFFPVPQGILFGGMYNSNSLLVLMKNILNIGVLIIFIQSHTWLKNEKE